MLKEVSTKLERQVVGCIACGRFLCRREGGCRIGCRSCRGSLRREGRSTGSIGIGTRNGSHLTADNIVGADIVEPTALILMGVDIELNGHVLVHLKIKLLDAVFAENAEDTTSGILSGNFDNIILRHPRVSCTCRHATLCWQYSNDSTC